MSAYRKKYNKGTTKIMLASQFRAKKNLTVKVDAKIQVAPLLHVVRKFNVGG